jgi:hypothetical protein
MCIGSSASLPVSASMNPDPSPLIWTRAPVSAWIYLTNIPWTRQASPPIRRKCQTYTRPDRLRPDIEVPQTVQSDGQFRFGPLDPPAGQPSLRWRQAQRPISCSHGPGVQQRPQILVDQFLHLRHGVVEHDLRVGDNVEVERGLAGHEFCAVGDPHSLGGNDGASVFLDLGCSQYWTSRGAHHRVFKQSKSALAFLLQLSRVHNFLIGNSPVFA